jgi:hypothetical protein
MASLLHQLETETRFALMPKSIDSLVDDIYLLLDEDTNHEPSEANLDWIANAVRELLRSRLSSRVREAAALRFSSMGRPDRQVWYYAREPDKAERMLPKTYFKFLYGDMIELLLLFLSKEAGHDVQSEQKQVEVKGVIGHCDAVVDGVTVDFKSASPYSFSKFQSGTFVEDDPFGYVGQISGYRETLGTDRAGFLVADKVHGDIHFAEVSKDLLDANKPAERIEHLRTVLSTDAEPPRCYPDKPEGKSGNRVLGVGCSYCPFKVHCWRDANDGEGLRTFYYSTGPRYFTVVTKEPRVQEDW